MIRVEDWVPTNGMTLEPNAINAVKELKSNVVVSAGPGAGKTELLAQRAEYLLATGACRYPRRILAISYKVDSARNIRERVRRRCGDELGRRFDSFTFHAFAKRIIDNYRILLTDEDALDSDYTIDSRNQIFRKQITFEQVVPLALKILRKSPHLRNAIQQTYSYVFLDEFQDTTATQYKLLKEVFLGSDAMLTAVGDSKQGIMRWAGAVDDIMKIFAKDFAAQELTLYQNYRSDPVLRRMQNRMVRDMDPPAALPDAAIQGNGGLIEVLDFKTSTDEASAIATRVKAWLDAGVLPCEIAVLVRQQPDLVCRQLMEELKYLGVAARNEQVYQDLMAEPIAAMIFSLIQVLVGDYQAEAYEHLMGLATLNGRSEETTLRNHRAINSFLVTKRRQFRSNQLTCSNPGEWRKVIEDFIAMISWPVVYALSPEYQHGKRVSELIENAVNLFAQELERDSDPLAAIERLSEDNAVRILTIHKSKGLEFEKVVVYGVERELFRSEDFDDCRAEFFVAVSRAKNELILTCVRHRRRPKIGVRYWNERRQPMQGLLGYAKLN